MSILPDILKKLLVCPVDQGDLEECSDRRELVCTSCRRVYSIRRGIPVMLADSPINRQTEPQKDHVNDQSLQNTRG